MTHIVSSIIKKRRGGSTYLYAATSARVQGRPRIVEQVYTWEPRTR